MIALSVRVVARFSYHSVWRRSNRCRSTLAHTHNPVKLPAPSRTDVCIESEFRERFFCVDDVLSLYAIQREHLKPCVDEQESSRDGMRCVEITWHIDGVPIRGVGTASRKRDAKRLAASELLRGVPLSHTASEQMRKQMVNSLRLRVGAEHLRDAAVPSAVPGEHAHQVVWRVAHVGSLPRELSVIGLGRTAADAQHRAMEKMFLEASDPRVRSLAMAGAQQIRFDAAVAQASKSEASRRAAVEAIVSNLTPAAASELVVRHNSLVLRRHIEAREDTTPHSTGFLCTLQWRWRDDGEQRVETTTGLGPSKRVAKGAAVHAMLVAHGFAADLTIEVLNRGALIRSLVKTQEDAALTAAITFLKTQPVAAWSLVLQDVWKMALTLGDVGRVAELGNAMRKVLTVPDKSFEGVPPESWEDMLDSCAVVPNGTTARACVAALERMPLMIGTFRSALHRDYFQHFRRLVAWERVAAIQAALGQVTDGNVGVSLWKEHCVLPFLTLSAGNDADFFKAGLRLNDVVELRPVGIDGAVLATVTSTTPKSLKCTFSCEIGKATCFEATKFTVRLLGSTTSSSRMALALRRLTQHPSDSVTDLHTLLLNSFSDEGRSIVNEDRHNPPARDFENESMVLNMMCRLAEGRGSVFNESQSKAVRSAIEQQLTLIHGPPGTGKTTAAVHIVSAWRHSGEKILCVADSNVAADNLHSNLKRFGIEALRFSMSGEDLDVSVRRVDTLAGTSTSQRQRANSDHLFDMVKGVADFQIVVTTCSSAGHPALKHISFPLVLIDECTQSVEPMSLVPLSHGCRRAVLIGDHRQLPPTVLSNEAQRGGLERSLFARLVEEGPTGGFGMAAEPVLLDEQWRMHPSISNFPNWHFYGGRIKDVAPERSLISGVPWPKSGEHRVLLVDVGGVESNHGTSFANDAEVSAVLDLIGHVTVSRAVLPEEIAILTPYQGQKRLIQHAFAHRAREDDLLGRVRIATVDGFQGAEVDLVVFSAVRSNVAGKLGFLQDARRANVLLTRARRGLIVFADASTMRQASGSVWASWLDMQESCGAVVPLADFQESFPATSL